MQNRIFNYCLSHARQTVECAFGILSTRFRIYKGALEQTHSVVEKLIRTTYILHNFLRRDVNNYADELSFIPNDDFEESNEQLIELLPTKVRSTREREKLTKLEKCSGIIL